MIINKAKRIVIKVGSSLIVDDKSSSIKETWLKSLLEDVANLKKRKKEVIITTSGAVAIGKRLMQIEHHDLRLEEKQAAAACGQTELVKKYQRLLNQHDYQTAQILLTLFDSENRRNYLNARNTIETLLAHNIVPIINENDTVATHELRFGDNDRLAARVVQMTSSDLLILLSDVDGLYTANPRLNPNAKHIAKVEQITPEIEAMGEKALNTGMGSGGMITKISAAKMATSSGCTVILTKGSHKNPINTLEQGGKHTIFTSNNTPHNARKQWIASSLNICGSLIADNGAIKALKQGKSLLPVGVIDIEGTFDRGDTVEIKDCKNKRIGVGISAYSYTDAKTIMGQQTQEIENIIGFSGRTEMIHRDNMAID